MRPMARRPRYTATSWGAGQRLSTPERSGEDADLHAGDALATGRDVRDHDHRIACLNLTLHYHDVPHRMPEQLAFDMFACDLEAMGINGAVTDPCLFLTSWARHFSGT